jgi:hypothetical protein
VALSSLVLGRSTIGATTGLALASSSTVLVSFTLYDCTPETACRPDASYNRTLAIFSWTMEAPQIQSIPYSSSSTTIPPNSTAALCTHFPYLPRIGTATQSLLGRFLPSAAASPPILLLSNPVSMVATIFTLRCHDILN